MASWKVTLPSPFVSAASKFSTTLLMNEARPLSLLPISDSCSVNSSLVKPVSFCGGGGGGMAPCMRDCSNWLSRASASFWKPLAISSSVTLPSPSLSSCEKISLALAVPVVSVLDELDEPMMADSALSRSLSWI